LVTGCALLFSAVANSLAGFEDCPAPSKGAIVHRFPRGLPGWRQTGATRLQAFGRKRVQGTRVMQIRSASGPRTRRDIFCSNTADLPWARRTPLVRETRNAHPRSGPGGGVFCPRGKAGPGPRPHGERVGADGVKKTWNCRFERNAGQGRGEGGVPVCGVPPRQGESSTHPVPAGSGSMLGSWPRIARRCRDCSWNRQAFSRRI
jgi:hypothetical protein